MTYIKMAFMTIGVCIAGISLLCTDTPTESAYTETPVTYKGLYGKLVDKSGNALSGAMVKAIALENALSKRSVTAPLDMSIADSVYTDSNGIYTFESLNAGTYNLQGDYHNRSMVVLITNIIYDSTGATKQVETDTLRAPGQITGRVKTQTQNDDGVLCYIPGTSYLSMTDDTGSFSLSDIPQGYYQLTYRKNGLKTVSDTGIKVRSGEKTVLSLKNMEADPNDLPPAPTGLLVTYDTLTGCATLSWNPVTVSDLAGYVIYGNDPLVINPIQRNTLLCTTTVYIDTIFLDLFDTTDRIVSYRIKTMDIDANLSDVYSKPLTITAPSPVKVRTFISWEFLNTIGDTASVNDTVSIIVSYRNATRKNVKLDWYMNRVDSVLSTKLFDTSSAGSDTIRTAWPVPATPIIYASITDAAGSVWKDSTSLTIVQDVPIPHAGNDTILPVNSTVLLHGTATQKFGSFVQWQWKVGSGNWNTTSSSDTMVTLPATAGTYVCSLAVVDDDGNRGVDGHRLYTIYKGFAAGYGHTLYLGSNGTVWACGLNNRGQLGDGETTTRITPCKILNNVIKIDASNQNSMFLKIDGSVWGCGWNSYGMLGDGTTVDRYTPVQVLTDVQNISSGELHSLFLKTDGSLWSCGSNHFGELGDGTQSQRTTPVAIMTDVKSMVASEYSHSLILKKDNSLWTCGLNGAGQLGDGTTTNKATPVQVMTDVVNISAGYIFSLILKSDGTLWSCGDNSKGQLGDGTTTSRAAPVQVMNDVRTIACGDYHSLIIKNDGSLWVCGQSGYQAADPATPVQIMTNVQSAAAGSAHSLVIKTDGTLWSFGVNNYGQLVDGTTVDRAVPVQIQLPDQ